jgi:hypothetical protein
MDQIMKRIRTKLLECLLAVLFLVSCTINTLIPSLTITKELSTSIPTITLTPESTLVIATETIPATQSSATEDMGLPPELWRDWPVVPIISERVKEIYQVGIANGNDPHAFSKIGDCQNVISLFLGTFDRTGSYTLGSTYDYLQSTIDQFKGSWIRQSIAGFYGFNAASELNPIFNDPKQCNVDETPVACEVRLHKPSIAIISLETWWGNDTKDYEKYLRRILDFLIDQGIVPIIGTKADNQEGDNSINFIIAKLAYEYDIPMWNFYAAVQSLPGKGLTEDGFHLSFAQNRFDNSVEMRSAWPWRNLTALQSIDAVWKYVDKQ